MIYVSPEAVAFIVDQGNRRRAENVLRNLGVPFEVTEGLAKVSVVGAGMHGVPGVMARVLRAMHRAAARVLQTTDSHANYLLPGERGRCGAGRPGVARRVWLGGCVSATGGEGV